MPVWFAVTVQVPAAPVNVIVDPLVPPLLQTPLAVNVTGLPEPPPVALTVKGGSLVSFGGSAAKIIVWVPCMIEKDAPSDRAEVKLSAALFAVMVQVPTDTAVTVVPDTEQMLLLEET